jgi:hypothetical protein
VALEIKGIIGGEGAVKAARRTDEENMLSPDSAESISQVVGKEKWFVTKVLS